jgi:Ca2+-binding RTX toxin-like protein
MLLVGNDGDDQINGGNGDDILNGKAGDDILDGGAGNDILKGLVGADTMIGGNGDDRIFVNNLTDTVVEDPGGGTDTVVVSVSGYTLDANVEVGAIASAGNVTLTGNAGDNTLVGNIGNDTLNGGDGDDWLNGGAGDDVLNGGAGDDTLKSSAGTEILTGGGDNDVFFFEIGTAHGDTAIDFDGNGAGIGDSLRFKGYGTAAEGASLVQLDATHWQINSADGLVQEVITLANAAAVDATDFLFI